MPTSLKMILHNKTGYNKIITHYTFQAFRNQGLTFKNSLQLHRDTRLRHYPQICLNVYN